MKFLLLVGTLLFCMSTFASGQCEIISASKAVQAMQILNEKLANSPLMVIDNYCEACMDELPRPIVVESIEHKIVQADTLSSLKINGKVVDLAYIYVDGENLANQIGCKTIAVSKNLD